MCSTAVMLPVQLARHSHYCQNTMPSVMLPVCLAMTSFLDVILQCAASKFVQQRRAHLLNRRPIMTSVVVPVHLAMTSCLDVILQCIASQFVRQHVAHLRIRWPYMTSVVYLAMTSGFGVILHCSVSQFVQQHMTHLRNRWPCMTSVMLPVYLALTSFLMSYCNVHHRNLCDSTRLI